MQGKEKMVVFTPNKIKVRIVSVLLFFMSVIGFFIWSKNEQIKPLLSIIVCLTVGLYLFFKSFSNAKIFLTSTRRLGEDCAGSGICVEVFPETAKKRPLCVLQIKKC